MNIEAVTTSPPLGSMDKGLASLRRASSMWIGVLLFLLVFAVFSPSLSYELVAVDDIHYISHNSSLFLNSNVTAHPRRIYAV